MKKIPTYIMGNIHILLIKSSTKLALSIQMNPVNKVIF